MVYLPGPYARPVSPFPVPVTAPVAGPFDSPTQQVCINVEWLPYIAGALKVLWLQSTFDTTNPADILTMQGKVADLISAFLSTQDGCGALTPPILCLSGSFADMQYGYEPTPGLVCDSSYVPGTGFEGCTDPGTGQQLINIQRVFSSDFILTSFEFRFFKNVLSAPYDILMSWVKDGTVVRTDSASGINGAFTIGANGLSVAVDSVSINAHTNISDSSVIAMDEWKLCYVGAFPLSDANTWEHIFDFTANDGGFTPYGAGQANYSNGVGWTTNDLVLGGNFRRLMQITKSFSAARVTHIEMLYDYTVGTANPGFDGADIFVDGFLEEVESQDNMLTANDQVFQWNGDLPGATSIILTLQPYADGSSSSYSGAALCKRVTLRGIGTDPF